MGPIVLLGDSIFDNARYVPGGEPVIEQLRAYLSGAAGAVITIDVVLTYFNSSSTKMLFSMFDVLDQAAQSGEISMWNGVRYISKNGRGCAGSVPVGVLRSRRVPVWSTRYVAP